MKPNKQPKMEFPEIRIAQVDELTPSQKHDIVRQIRPAIEEDTGVRFKQVVNGVTPGKKDSRHDVFRMSAIGHDGATSSMYVKRFRNKKDAAYEKEMIQAVKDRGFDGLNPIGRGVFDISEHGFALVTEEIPRLETLNIVDWRDYRRTWRGEKGAHSDHLSNLMHDVAHYVGDLHRNGIGYHDLVLQNIGKVPSGELIPFDLEFVKLYNPDDKYNFQFIVDKQNDLLSLARSLAVSIGVFEEDYDAFKDMLCSDLLMPYAKATGDLRMFEQAETMARWGVEWANKQRDQEAARRLALSNLAKALKDDSFRPAD